MQLVNRIMRYVINGFFLSGVAAHAPDSVCIHQQAIRAAILRLPLKH